jgi:flagellar motor switch protein FliN/FliY
VGAAGGRLAANRRQECSVPSQKKNPAAPPAAASAAEEPAGSSDESRALRPFLDVPIDVTVELARKKLKVREILNLQIDSIIQMDQSAGENVDLRLNGVAVGNGEIVVIEDTMGLRVTDLKVIAGDRE